MRARRLRLVPTATTATTVCEHGNGYGNNGYAAAAAGCWLLVLTGGKDHDKNSFVVGYRSILDYRRLIRLHWCSIIVEPTLKGVRRERAKDSKDASEMRR
ncbi:hypothetical protein M0804_015472 [Polistes exclamans]|nr:hypothetical protein M0804_015472 [Polistes exclamans]